MLDAGPSTIHSRPLPRLPQWMELGKLTSTRSRAPERDSDWDDQSGEMMARSDVVRALQSDLDDPGSLKSGEYLEERILRTIRCGLLAGDRDGVVEALREWLTLRREPQTMLAVTVAKSEKLTELVLEIEALRVDVLAGRAFPKFYLRWIDEALTVVGGSRP